MLDTVFPKIHKEGYKFIIIFVFITLILYFINGFLGFSEIVCPKIIEDKIKVVIMLFFIIKM